MNRYWSGMASGMVLWAGLWCGSPLRAEEPRGADATQSGGPVLHLPEGQGTWVKVRFKANPESTAGKSLRGGICLGDRRGAEIPNSCLFIEASPHFRDAAAPVVEPNGRDLRYFAQKGEREIFVPAAAEEIQLLGFLYGAPDRKLALDYSISVSELGPDAKVSDAPVFAHKLVVDHESRAGTHLIELPIERVSGAN